MNNPSDAFRIVMLGSSTGGLPVVEKLLHGLDPAKYSVLVAQHMPEGYTTMWAARLDRNTPFVVVEAHSGMVIVPGTAYIAPGNRHMMLGRETPYRILISDDEPVNRFRPSIEMLFSSAEPHDHTRIIPVMMTGMCSDGVRAMVRLHSKGFLTMAQDEQSSVVFGMNREAIKKGGVQLVLSPDEMINYLNGL
ncbi:MAG: chemotaxis protein CheB [Spirochaetes bacterium]|nr:chemotaxis protein CheB [Spirochaetota bacterium]